MEKCSLYRDGESEASKYKWIESEKAGRDLGHSAIQRWFKEHWWRYCRARWMEHLQGTRYWQELDRGDFGLLQNPPPSSHPTLMDQILARLRTGQENLNIITWAHDERLPIDEVLRILELLDVNSRRPAPVYELTA